MPAGSAMTSASARQARCINRAAEAWLHGSNKSPAGGTALSSDACVCVRAGPHQAAKQ